MQSAAQEARMRLVDAGGRAAQDLGTGRILGQILVYLYLWDGPRSLDEIELDLGLSKAAVSGTTRRLEAMGFLKRSWRQGDRKVYYRTVDNLADLFRDGMVSVLRRKVEQTGGELDTAAAMLELVESDPDAQFLLGRIRRASALRRRIDRILGSRLLRYLAR